MGYRFGEEAGGSNHEDLDFQMSTAPRLKKLISGRNAERDLWGWKDPGAVFKIEEVLTDLRNPYFITVFRDPYAIALSEYKYNQRDIASGLKVAVGHLTKLAFFQLSHPQFPNMGISYEKAINGNAKLVDDIIMYLGLTVTSDQRQKAIDFVQPERYVNI